MKTKKITLLSLAISMVSGITNLHAQMDNSINGDPAAFKMLQSRTVIVEMKEEDPKMVAYISKNPKSADGLKRYKDFIANNNSMLKKAVDTYWKFNSSIQYKTTTELANIIGKSSDYVIISFRSVGEGSLEQGNYDTYSIPLLWFDRSERNGNEEPDDYVYLPPNSISDEAARPEEWRYVQSDYDFAVIQLQAHINYMISADTKMIYEEYAKIMSQQNCGKMKDNTLILDKDQLDNNADDRSIETLYKGLFDVTDGQANVVFENHEDGKQIVFSFPYEIVSGSTDVVTNLAFHFAKAAVDCKTGELLYFYKPSGDMGKGSTTTWQYGLRKNLFSNMGKCK